MANRGLPPLFGAPWERTNGTSRWEREEAEAEASSEEIIKTLRYNTLFDTLEKGVIGNLEAAQGRLARGDFWGALEWLTVAHEHLGENHTIIADAPLQIQRQYFESHRYKDALSRLGAFQEQLAIRMK